MTSFIFGGNTNQTYDQLQNRRRIADQLIAQNAQTPRNVGEGLASIGRALAARAIERRADEQEGRLRRQFDTDFASLFGGSPTTQNIQGTTPSVRAVEGGLPPSLIQSESGGDFLATNDVPGSGGIGHFGRGQFSHGRLQDAMAAGVIPQGTTPDQFLNNPQMQQDVEQWHVGAVQNFIGQNGLDRYVGQTINGTQVTPQGMLAVAHLGGNQGLQRYLETGGQYNPSDANGTSLADYMGQHGEQPDQATQAGPSGPNMARIAQLLAVGDNPLASPMQRQLVEMLMQNEISQGQPLNPLQAVQLERAQFELDRLRNPEPDELRELQIERERYDLDQRAAEDEAEAAGAQQQQADRNEFTARSASIVLEDIGRIRGMVADDRSLPTTGAMGGALSNVPGTQAYDIGQLVLGIRANIGFDRLQQMREASPTGGALGNVTIGELQRLEAVLGSLNQSQSQAQFVQNLNRLESLYQDILRKASAYPNAAEFGFGGAVQEAPSGPSSSGIPQGVDPDLWQMMTPEERALWN